jgi:hypothetical protein
MQAGNGMRWLLMAVALATAGPSLGHTPPVFIREWGAQSSSNVPHHIALSALLALALPPRAFRSLPLPPGRQARDKHGGHLAGLLVRSQLVSN